MVPHFYQSETCEKIKKSGFQLAGANHARSMPDSYPIHTPNLHSKPKTHVCHKEALASRYVFCQAGFWNLPRLLRKQHAHNAPVCNSPDHRCPIRKPRILGSLGPLEAVGEFVRRPFAYLSKGPRSLSHSLPPSPPPSNVASLWAVYYYPLPENDKKPQKRITSEPLERGLLGMRASFHSRGLRFRVFQGCSGRSSGGDGSGLGEFTGEVK